MSNYNNYTGNDKMPNESYNNDPMLQQINELSQSNKKLSAVRVSQFNVKDSNISITQANDSSITTPSTKTYKFFPPGGLHRKNRLKPIEDKNDVALKYLNDLPDLPKTPLPIKIAKKRRTTNNCRKSLSRKIISIPDIKENSDIARIRNDQNEQNDTENVSCVLSNTHKKHLPITITENTKNGIIEINQFNSYYREYEIALSYNESHPLVTYNESNIHPLVTYNDRKSVVENVITTNNGNNLENVFSCCSTLNYIISQLKLIENFMVQLREERDSDKKLEIIQTSKNIANLLYRELSKLMENEFMTRKV